jgi:hypothetical protein
MFIWRGGWRGDEIKSESEHIIRNNKDLQKEADYINTNPLLWKQDDENLINIKPKERLAR